MKNLFTWPDNIGTNYIDPLYEGDATSGLYRRVDDLLTGDYKPWLGLDPIANLGTTTPEAEQTMSKFINYLDDNKLVNNLTFYDFWETPIVVATKKLIDSVNITATATDPVVITTTTPHEFESGMKMEFSNLDGTLGDYYTGQDMYSIVLSSTQLQIALDPALSQIVGFEAPVPDVLINDELNYLYSANGGKVNVNLSRLEIDAPDGTAIDINSVVNNGDALVGNTYYLKTESTPRYYDLYKDALLTDPLSLDDLTPFQTTIPATINQLTSPATITTTAPLASHQLDIYVNNPTVWVSGNTYFNGTVPNEHFYYLTATGQPNEYAIYQNSTRNLPLNWGDKTYIQTGRELNIGINPEVAWTQNDIAKISLTNSTYLEDGDEVDLSYSNVPNVNYFIKSTVINDIFELYKDQALTQPLTINDVTVPTNSRGLQSAFEEVTDSFNPFTLYYKNTNPASGGQPAFWSQATQIMKSTKAFPKFDIALGENVEFEYIGADDRWKAVNKPALPFDINLNTAPPVPFAVLDQNNFPRWIGDDDDKILFWSDDSEMVSWATAGNVGGMYVKFDSLEKYGITKILDIQTTYGYVNLFPVYNSALPSQGTLITNGNYVLFMVNYSSVDMWDMVTEFTYNNPGNIEFTPIVNSNPARVSTTAQLTSDQLKLWSKDLIRGNNLIGYYTYIPAETDIYLKPTANPLEYEVYQDRGWIDPDTSTQYGWTTPYDFSTRPDGENVRTWTQRPGQGTTQFPHSGANYLAGESTLTMGQLPAASASAVTPDTWLTTYGDTNAQVPDRAVNTAVNIASINTQGANVTVQLPLVDTTTGQIAVATDEPLKYEIDTVEIVMPGNKVYSYQDTNNNTQFGARIDPDFYWKAGSDFATDYSWNNETAAQFNVGVDANGRLSSVTLVEEPDAEGRYRFPAEIVMPIEALPSTYVPVPQTPAEQQDVWDTDDEWTTTQYSPKKLWPTVVTPMSASINLSTPSTINNSQNGIKYARKSGFTKWTLDVEYPPMKADQFREFHAIAQAASGQATPFYFVLRNSDGNNILWPDFGKAGTSNIPLLRYDVEPGDTTMMLEGFAGFEQNAFQRGEVFISGENDNGALHTAVNTVNANAYGEAFIRIAQPLKNAQVTSSPQYKDPYWAVVTLDSDDFSYSVDTAGFYNMSVSFSLDSWKADGGEVTPVIPGAIAEELSLGGLFDLIRALSLLGFTRLPIGVTGAGVNTSLTDSGFDGLVDYLRIF